MKKNLFNNSIDYLITIIIIIISGAVIYQTYNKQFLVFSFILFFIVYLLRNNCLKISKKNFVLITLMLLFLLLNCSLNINDGEIFKYISIMIRLVMPLMLISILDFETFKYKYCNIIYLLSLISLVFYFVVKIYPEFVNNFGIIYDFAGKKFSNAYLYAYGLPMIKGYRNNSIFWEPGAFQAIVNLALFFSLHLSNKKINVKDYIYILTLITTGSTIGYILLIINVSIYILNNKKWRIFKYFILITSITLFLALGLGNVIFDKFEEGNISFNRRTADFVTDLSIAGSSVESLIIGTGPSKYLEEFPEYLSIIYNLEGTSSSNGITSTISKYGIIFLFILMYYYFNGINYLLKNKLYVVIITIAFCIVFATEDFIFSPLFLLIGAYKNCFKEGS